MLLRTLKQINKFRLSVLNNAEKKIHLKWIRSLITIYYLYLAYYGLFVVDYNKITHPSWKNLKNNWWKCITVWNLVLQIRYFLMSFALDHVDNIPLVPKTLRRFIKWSKSVQDYCFMTFDVPSTIWVCTLFWCIRLLNKPIFYPEEMQSWVPEWLNHAVHTNPLFVMLFLMVFQFHQNPPIKRALCGMYGLFSSYIFCLVYTRWTTGQWVYIVIEEVIDNIPLTIVLTLFIGFIAPYFILLGGYKLNDFIWNEKFIKTC